MSTRDSFLQQDPRIYILYSTREAHPTFRVDVAVLFGKYLPRLGIMSDLVAPIDPKTGRGWSGGCAFGPRMERPTGIRKRFAYAICDLLLLLRARDRYDAIQVRDRPIGALMGLLAAKRARIPFFYWMSFSFPEAWTDMARWGTVYGTAYRIYLHLKGRASHYVLYRWVLPRSDHVFVQSDRMRDDVQQHGIPRDRMTAVPMGVDLEASDGALSTTAGSRLSGREVVVYVGALERIRHPEVMIDAIALIRDKWPNVLLVLVGDSQISGDRQWLERRCQELGIEQNVFFTGWVSHKMAQGFLRSAQIGLSPFPVSPGFATASPTKIVEYAVHGLPVVANDHPDQEDLLKAGGGGVCVPMTAAGFAAGIDRLLGDPIAAKSMGEQGREYVRSVRSYCAISRALAQTYFGLVEERTERRRSVENGRAQGEAERDAKRVRGI